MADISSIKLPDNSVYNIKDASALRDAPSDGVTYGRKDGAWVSVESGGGGGDLPYDILNEVYPVGSVICMNTKTNPSTFTGGTWELIDKGFSSYYNYTDTGNFTKGTAITSVTDPVISRSGHSVTLKITFVNTNALSGTNTTVGTWNWSKVGISAIGYTQVFIGLAEGYGILQMDIASSTGVMRVIDVIARTGSVSGNTSSNSPIAAGVTCYAEVTFTVDSSRMLDSACDKFYYKRTALAETSGSIVLNGDTTSYGTV